MSSRQRGRRAGCQDYQVQFVNLVSPCIPGPNSRLKPAVVDSLASRPGRENIARPESAVETLVLGLDLFGTFVFALRGAMAGVPHRFGLFGVVAPSHPAANARGLM